jgi:MFS family permease
VRSLLRRVVDAVVPARLGSSFRWLLASAVANNIGDGIVIAAGPLLVASLTRDPFLVALALFMEHLPVFLFALVGGVAADRFDRRAMVVVANLARAVVFGILVALIVTGQVGIGLVLLALFLLGTGEVFADSASSTLVPGLVARDDLGVANARMNGAFVLANQLVFPAVGALLFAVAPPLPFATTALCVLLGAVLVSRIVIDTRPAPAASPGVWAELKDGFRWLSHHPPMRTLTLTIFAFNVTYGAAWSVLVLYADEQLAMDAAGFGLLTTAMAVGGVVGTLSYGALERRFSLADIMRVGLVIETFTHLSLALTTSPAGALGTMVVFGAHAFVWGTTATVVRQRAVPDEFLGRVGGVYRLAVVGGMVIGTPVGGLLARAFGITAPFWFGFVGSAVLVIVLWRQFDNIAHAGDHVPHGPVVAEPGQA